MYFSNGKSVSGFGFQPVTEPDETLTFSMKCPHLKIKQTNKKKKQTHKPTMMMIIWERGYHQFNQFLPERHTGIS